MRLLKSFTPKPTQFPETVVCSCWLASHYWPVVFLQISYTFCLGVWIGCLASPSHTCSKW